MPHSLLHKFILQFQSLTIGFYYQLCYIIVSFLMALLIFQFIKKLLFVFQKALNKYKRTPKKRSLFLVSWLLGLGLLFPGYHSYFTSESVIIATCALILTTIICMRIVKAVAPKLLHSPLMALIITSSLLLFSGFFNPLILLLGKTELKLGVIHTSILKILQSAGLITLLTWAAIYLSNRFESKISKNTQLSQSTYILLSKVFRVSLITLSIFLGMSLVGLDLSIITFFAGAIGVAVGFSLQNILSNIFCGIIILLDRSIRPGDVITSDDIGTYGVVHKLNARYVSVRTREGVEHLIPNEFFVNKQAESWTHRDPYIRINIPLQVSVSSDLELVEAILLKIAKKTERVIKNPEPAVRFMAMNSYVVDVSLRVWIADPANGKSSIKTSIYKSIVKEFKEEGIEIPHPPLSVYLRSGEIKPDGLSASLLNKR